MPLDLCQSSEVPQIVIDLRLRQNTDTVHYNIRVEPYIFLFTYDLLISVTLCIIFNSITLFSFHFCLHFPKLVLNVPFHDLSHMYHDLFISVCFFPVLTSFLAEITCVSLQQSWPIFIHEKYVYTVSAGCYCTN